MKNGYKHKTGTFGTDGEWYTAHLFRMARLNHGSLRPDIISTGNYSPEIAIEVKTGLNKKGVLTEYQLHYEVQCVDDYQRIFGEDPPEKPGSLPGLGRLNLSQSRVTFYYDMLNRSNRTRSHEIDTPFSAIKFNWGDHHIVPGEYGFWAFVVARSMRTGENISEVADEVRGTMKRCILEERSNYRNSKGRQSWQDLHARDILAFFHDDVSLTTKKGKERVQRIAENYEEVEKLKRIQIDGPNNTKIYVLAKPDDTEIFDMQMRNIVESRIEIVEKITRARKRALPLLEDLPRTDIGATLYGNGKVPIEQLNGRITRSEAGRLERLTKWVGPRESALTIDDTIPI